MTASSKLKDKNRFKMTSFDLLTNPLRADHPFGKYSFQREILHILQALYISILSN